MKTKIKFLQDQIDRATAFIPEGYLIAKDTLPERVELLVQGFYAFHAAIEELRKDREILHSALALFQDCKNCYGQFDTAENALNTIGD